MNAVESIFHVVLDASWRMACLVLVLLAWRSLLRRHVSARVLYWAWIAVAVRLLLPLAVSVSWSPFNLARFAYRAPPVPATSMLAVDNGPSVAAMSRLAPLAPVPFLERPPARVAARSAGRWAALAWGLGVIVLVSGRIRAHRRFVRRLPPSPTANDATLVAPAVEAAAELGVRGVSIFITDSVGAPALHGIFRPSLLFPPGLLEQLSRREIKLIVAHELSHHQRRDLLAQFLIQAAQILHWFNPLIWMAARAARQDCELACDEHVVQRLGSTEPRVYGATLLKILGLVNPAPQAALGLGVVRSKQQIKRRIQMIIADKPSALTRTVLGCTLLALVASLSLTREIRAQQPANATGPAVTTTAPNGWWKNGTQNAVAYVAGLDRSQTHQGLPSAYVKSIQPAIEGFGGLMQSCSAEKYIGKRLRFSAWMKTENANDGGAHLWFRVDGKESGAMLQFDNMDNRPVKGTTDWRQYSVVLDVPATAAALAYGFFIQGTGQAWGSDVKIEEVGADVPSTNLTPKKARELPSAPVNLRFD